MSGPFPYYDWQANHNMGPGRYWHRGGRGPSRILWFVIGAASATFWMKKKHYDENGERIFGGHCKRHALPAPPPPPPSAPDDRWSARDIPKAINNIGPPGAWGWGEQKPMQQTETLVDQRQAKQMEQTWTEQKQSKQIDYEREQLATFSRQAADTMTELTESTLDSVMSTAQALKAKLAEHKAQREKQQAIIDKQLEEQRRNPPRLV